MSRPDTGVGDDFAHYTVQVAEITGAHGVKGEVKALCTSDVPDRLGQLDEVLIRPKAHEPFVSSVTRARQIPHKRVYILGLEGVNSREDAERLVGAELAIPEGQSPPLPADTYYVGDLLGALVVTRDGRELGRLSEVLYTGANDVYVTDQGHLLPATAEVVAEVDIEGHRIVVTPLPGMLD